MEDDELDNKEGNAKKEEIVSLKDFSPEQDTESDNKEKNIFYERFRRFYG